MWRANRADDRADAGDRERRLHRLAGADTFERRVDADPAGHRQDGMGSAVASLRDDVGRAELTGKSLPSAVPRERDDPLCPQPRSRDHSAQPHSAIAHDRYDVAALHACADRGVVTGAHDVRERHQRTQRLFRVARSWDFHERRVGERTTHALALAAVDTVVPEGAAVHAVGRPAASAVGTRPVAERERRYDEVAPGDRSYLGPDLLDDADELVPDWPEGMWGQAALIPEVGTADAPENDTDDGVGRLDDDRVGPVPDFDLVRTVVDRSAHDSLPKATRAVGLLATMKPWA